MNYELKHRVKEIELSLCLEVIYRLNFLVKLSDNDVDYYNMDEENNERHD